jgi:hypothetical protein
MPTIKIKNSQTTTNTPGSLVQGELAINEQDELLFYRDGAGSVQSFDLNTVAGAAVDQPMSDFHPAVVFDIDASFPKCYPDGGQIVGSAVDAPWDGTTRRANSFYRGGSDAISTDDPAWVDNGNNSYFLGSLFDYLSITGKSEAAIGNGNTNFFNGLHQTGVDGTPWFFGFYFRTGTSGWGANALFGTMDNSPGYDNGIEIVISDGFSIAAQVRVSVARGGVFTTNDFGAAGGLADATDYFIGVSGDPTNTDGLRVWIDSATALTDADMHSGTSNNPSNGNAALMGRSDGGLSLGTNARLYQAFGGVGYLTDSEMDIFRAVVESRRGVTLP